MKRMVDEFGPDNFHSRNDIGMDFEILMKGKSNRQCAYK